MAEFPRHPFLLSPDETARVLGTDLERGLASAQVARLQAEYPKNELDIDGATAWYRILAKQILNAMIIVLVFAMALSFGISDYVEGGVLSAVIILNVAVGFYQENRAEQRMEALRALSSPSAMLLRDGKTRVVPNPEVVPGDIVLLKTGDTVPADLRLFETMNLACEEAQLTGESIPVEKTADNNMKAQGSEKTVTTEDELGIADRVNMAYATTVVQKGRGRGITTATGMNTEVGKIAASTSRKVRKPGRSMNWRKYGKRQSAVGLTKRVYDAVGRFLGLTEGTPLQRKLSGLAYILFLCAIVLALIVFAVNKFHMRHEVIIYATSLGIAIIPESLVAVLTITMVVAVTVMRKANVVVRDLSALEALGGVTNICSDKTGTLTEGAMIVRNVWVPFAHSYTVRNTEDPNDPTQGHVAYSRVSEEESLRDNKEEEKGSEENTTSLRFEIPLEHLERFDTSSKSDASPEVIASMSDELKPFLLSSALCNLANLRFDETEWGWQATGEPTEIALQVFAHRFGCGKKALERQGWNQVAEFPFDSEIKRMSVVYNAPPEQGGEKGSSSPFVPAGNSMVFTKGAVERLLDLCSFVGTAGERQEMTEEVRESVLAQMDALASQGQRVLAVACKTWDGRFTARQSLSPEREETLRASVEKDLTLLGLAGIHDPPRRETKSSIAECSAAGIKVHMLTGDHPETARAIAKEVGIIPRNTGVLPERIAASIVTKATDFDRMTDDEIDALDELPLVIARCAPDTKTRMIDALRRRGASMAMTGDGVNDAPSLSRADVGIAMGSGSDVAKSEAKIVLTDDKFNSIVAAIRQGRRMFDNIQKFVLHLLASNVGEVILLGAGLGFVDSSGFTVFPVSPLQIIWINMVTSSFPAFGLGGEAAASDVMQRPPHDKKRGIFTTQIIVDMVVYGVLMGACTMATFCIVIYGANGGNLGQDCNTKFSPGCEAVFRARAATFAELTWLILVSAWEFKSLRRSMFRLHRDDARPFPFFKDVYSNRFLFWSVVIGGLTVFPVVYLPFINVHFFKHMGISWEWAVSVGFTVVFVTGVELWKLAKRRFGWLDDCAVDRGYWEQGADDVSSLRPAWSLSSLRSMVSISWQEAIDMTVKRLWGRD